MPSRKPNVSQPQRFQLGADLSPVPRRLAGAAPRSGATFDDGDTLTDMATFDDDWRFCEEMARDPRQDLYLDANDPIGVACARMIIEASRREVLRRYRPRHWLFGLTLESTGIEIAVVDDPNQGIQYALRDHNHSPAVLIAKHPDPKIIVDKAVDDLIARSSGRRS